MALYLLYLMTEDKFHIEKIIKSDNGTNNISQEKNKTEIKCIKEISQKIS